MTKYVNDNGVSEMWLNIKNWVTSQLLGYSQIGHTHSASDITSGLATIATSGSYNDLSNKPTIPTVNNATLTIQKNGTNVQTFTANQSTNATANITVPTKTSDLTNDSGFITSDDTKIPLAGSNAISGSLIPATDNSIDVGSSTKNIKMLHTKGITINGTQFLPSNYIPRSGGVVLTGDTFARNVDDSELRLIGGSAYNLGAYLILYGKNNSASPGQITLACRKSDGTAVILSLQPNGTATWNGNVIRPNTDNTCDLGSSTYNFKNVYAYKLILKNSYIVRTANNDYLGLCGGTDYSSGAYFTLYGKDSTINTGGFRLRANDGTNSKELIGKPDGTLSWNGNIIPSADNTCDLGSASNRFRYIYGVVKTGKIAHRVNDDLLQIYGGTDETGGAGILLNGKNRASDAGNFRIVARSTSANATLLGTPTALSWSGSSFRPSSDGNATLGTGSIRWNQIYSTNSAISTSDERQKDNIKQIDDKLLQAWGNVNIVQFNFKDALEKKGENARLHTGYIAQNIQQACEEKGVNPNDYGLFCFDSWEEQEEKKDENGEVIEPYRAKGDLYSLRYEEALIVECAYLRKCIKELRNEIEELKKGNSTK